MESRLDVNRGVIVPCVRDYDYERAEEPVALNGETYLRLADVNLDDPEAIFAFVSEYGPLGGANAFATLMRDAPYALERMYRSRLNWRVEANKKRRALREEATRTNPSLFHREPDEPRELPRGLDLELATWAHTETLDEFRFAARCLRDLTAAWDMFRRGLDASSMVWDSPARIELDIVGSDTFPVALLGMVLPSFMRQFNPQLIFSWSGPGLPVMFPLTKLPPRSTQGGVNVEPLRGPTRASLYAICALELFNHIIENAEYRTCANERCKRTFVHQQGRAEKGQHRSRGVLYCSPACARATAQREYRRRRKRRDGAPEA